MIKDHSEGVNLMECAVLSYHFLYECVLCPSLWGPSLVLCTQSCCVCQSLRNTSQ